MGKWSAAQFLCFHKVLYKLYHRCDCCAITKHWYCSISLITMMVTTSGDVFSKVGEISLVRTPFLTKILTAQEKVRNALEGLSCRAFIYGMHGRCREHNYALAFTHRRIRENKRKMPHFNCNFWLRYLPLKSWVRHDISKAIYGDNNRCCRVNTLALTHRRS